MHRSIHLAIVALPLTLLIAGCGGEETTDAERTGDVTRQRIGEARSGLPSAAAAKLDSGNTAYRAGDYERALAHYRAATELEEETAAPWFGVYMAYTALGREDSARAALERAGSLSESAGAFHGGDSVHGAPDSHDTAGGVHNPQEADGREDPHPGAEAPGDGGDS